MKKKPIYGAGTVVGLILGLILIAAVGSLRADVLASEDQGVRPASTGEVTVLDPYTCKTVTVRITPASWRRIRPPVGRGPIRGPWRPIRIPPRRPSRSAYRPGCPGWYGR